MVRGVRVRPGREQRLHDRELPASQTNEVKGRAAPGVPTVLVSPALDEHFHHALEHGIEPVALSLSRVRHGLEGQVVQRRESLVVAHVRRSAGVDKELGGLGELRLAGRAVDDLRALHQRVGTDRLDDRRKHPVTPGVGDLEAAGRTRPLGKGCELPGAKLTEPVRGLFLG